MRRSGIWEEYQEWKTYRDTLLGQIRKLNGDLPADTRFAGRHVENLCELEAEIVSYYEEWGVTDSEDWEN